MGKSFVYCFLLLLVSVTGFAQSQKGQTKVIVDSKTKVPLDYVAIQSDDNSIRLMSNRDGKFIFIGDPKIKFFTFYKMGYARLTMEPGSLGRTDSIFLQEKQLQLDEVFVSSRKLDTVVRDKRFYVNDYCVLPNENFLLITSKINISGFEVCYYDKSRGISQTKKIKDEDNARFVVDCFKNIHVVTSGFSRQIFFDSDTGFQFLPKYKRQVFDSALAPCVLRIDTEVILKQIAPPTKLQGNYADASINAPFFDYIRVSRHNRELFYRASYSEHMLEMMSHEIEDTRATARNEFVADNLIAMFFSQIAGPIYAPVFLKNDTVVLFDFQKNSIDFLSRQGRPLKSTKINQDHFASVHNYEILYDGIARKFYMKMTEANRPVVKQIDIYSGNAINTVKLEKTFAKNIQVVNNRFFYLVKEREWDDTQYLYQQN